MSLDTAEKSAALKPEGSYDAPLHGWICFHCGETFSVAEQGSFHAAEKAAREHFGPTPAWDPVCIDRAKHGDDELLNRMRNAELELERALEARNQAQEETEVAAGRLSAWSTRFGVESPHGAWNQLDSMTGRALAAEERVKALELLINTPVVDNFLKAVRLEAAHQCERWGVDNDAKKEPQDWFWLLGYLAGKALAAFLAGDKQKALHHCISSAAVCLNWHAHIAGLRAMGKSPAPL